MTATSPRRRSRRLLLALVVLVFLGGGYLALRPAAAGPAPYGIRLAEGTLPDTPAEHRRTARYEQQRRAAVVALLGRRASAVLHHDRRAFLATVDRRQHAFYQHEEQVFDELGQLPLQAWSYQVGPDEHAYPPTEIDLARYHADVYAPALTLLLQLRGYDRAPVARAQVYTFVERSGHWLIASDSDYDSHLLVDTKVDPWDVSPITVATGRHTLVIGSTQDADRLPGIAAMADAAVETVAKAWPTGWTRRVVVEVSRDPRVLSGMLLGDQSTQNVAAIAQPQLPVVDQYTVERTTRPRPVGDRVVVDPRVMADYAPEDFRRLLTHEITHVATLDSTDVGSPAWMVEGFAEYVADQGRDPAASVDDTLFQQVSRGNPPAWLPTSDDFAMSHSRTDYDEGWLACRYIAERWGQPKLRALYRALGRIDDPAEAFVRSDAAMRALLGTSQQAFVAAWQRYLTETLHPAS